jgi:hypothetical protein
MRVVRKGQASPRWAFMNGFLVSRDGRPYLDRLRLVQTPLFGVYLHRIHQPDTDRDPHDHPWPFLSLVLSGAYTERVWAGKGHRRDDLHSLEFRRRRGSLHRMSVKRAHMITEVDGLLWTLVVTGPRVRDWGFWTDMGLVSWREYLGGDITGAQGLSERSALWA